MRREATGRARDRNNIRNRVLNPSIKRAEALLRERKSSDSAPTRERSDGVRVTHVPSHAGRRTAITWWAEAGYDERDVMMWVGHEDPVLTLRLYRQARNRPRDPRVAAAMAEVPAKERRAPRHRRRERSPERGPLRQVRSADLRRPGFWGWKQSCPQNPWVSGGGGRRGVSGFAKPHS